MSVTATRQTFTRPPAAPKPQLICAGRITEVDNAYEGKSGKYFVVPILLSHIDGGQDQKVYWLFHPQFLRKYSVVELQQFAEDDPSAYRIFCQHVAQEEGKTSHLQGLTVTPESFDELAGRLIGLGVDTMETSETNAKLVSDVIRQYFLGEVPDTVVGYILRQQSEATDEKNENGKTIYVPSRWMEIGGYWVVNAENIKKQAKRAEKSKGKIKMSYTGTVPF